MAGIKITDLPAAPSAQLTDVFPVDQLPGPITYKESNSQLLSLFKSSGGEALTRTDDTNVTMTLGGSPSIALLNATSMTLGWTGQLSVPRGGTGLAALTAHYIPIGNGTSAITLLAPSATSGIPLISQGAASDPAYGTAVVAGGGTGNTTFTAYSVICAGTTATGAFQNVVGVGNAGEQLTSNGAGLLPTWQASGGVTPAALTKGDDTNVTLTLAGTPATALLQATSITAGWTGQVYCDADSFELLAATATAGQIPRSGANAAPTWSTATYPAAAGTSGNVLSSDGTNWNSTSPAGIGSPLTTKGDLYTYSTVNARLAAGATNGQILQVNSGATTGLAWSTATFPATATNTARILRSDGTNWVETTSTFADTYAASGFLYANGSNNVAGLATANNGLPVTGNTGVPVMLAGPAATGRVLTSNAAAAPSWSTSTFPSVGGTAGNILISDGTNYIASTSLWPNTVGTAGKILRSDGTTNAYTTSTYPDTNAVSTLLYASSANVMAALATANSGVLVTSSGGVPSISSTLPAFTTSSITFSPTTGGIVGTTTNDSAAAGKVGEIISSVIASASGVSNTSNTARDVTSISLTAGDWDVWGNVTFNGNAATAVQALIGWISSTSATLPDTSISASKITPAAPVLFSIAPDGFCVPSLRLSLSGTTTIYLSSYAFFSVSTCTSYGGIYARRVR